MPQSRLSNAGWTAAYRDDSAGNTANVYDVNFGNSFFFGGGLSTNNINAGSLLTPEEAWNIDTKVDDGMPGQGRLYPGVRNDCTLASSDTDFAAEYNLSNSTTVCYLIFSKAF